MTIGGNRISSSLATTQLRTEGKKTRLIFTEQGAYLDGHDNLKEREEGSRGLLEALAKRNGAACRVTGAAKAVRGEVMLPIL